MTMMSDLSFDWTIIFLGFMFIGSIFGVGLGVVSIATRTKHRGWESGWSLIARDLFTIFAVAAVYFAYTEGRLDSFWAFILAGVTQVPVGAYILWKDFSFRKKIGDDSPFF